MRTCSILLFYITTWSRPPEGKQVKFGYRELFKVRENIQEASWVYLPMLAFNRKIYQWIFQTITGQQRIISALPSSFFLWERS